MAPITSSQGSGPIWQKIAAQGYDPTTQKWAVDDLIAAHGQHSVTVPNVADGSYFLRPEIIALHEADSLHDQDSSRGAQFYMECVQVKVAGGSGSAMPAGVSFPGVYKDSDPGVHFNLYGSFSTYPLPGPTVWSPGAASKAATSSVAAPVSSSAAVSSATSVSSVAAPAPTSSSAAEAATTASSSIAAVSSVVAPAASGTFVNSITGSLVWIYTPTGAPAAAVASSTSLANVAVPTTLATSVRPSSPATSSAASDEGDGEDCSDDDGSDSTPETSAAAVTSAAAAAPTTTSGGDDDDCSED